MEDTLARLQALDGDQVAAACRTTLTILVQNAMENVENKIFEVLDIIAEKVIILENNITNCTNRRIMIAEIRQNENYVLWYIK